MVFFVSSQKTAYELRISDWSSDVCSSDLDTAYACRYAVAVAANVAAVSADLQQAWSAQGDFGRQFTSPSADNDLYRSQQEVAAEAVKALSTGDRKSTRLNSSH